jgi:DNA recombination protein RmuC
MDSSQYEENVATKKNSADRVEFAVKIPDKDDSRTYIYLPIDSKFPSDIYDRIIEASNGGDPDGLKRAVKELEQRIKGEARTIRDKYIDPPHTTDFAVMFLPTEGLYAETIRIPGLMDYCQREYRIVISGPTTIAALLNSLSIGFRYLTVNKNSREILRTLSAVKAQYEKFGELITKTQKKLSEAQSATDDLKSRSDIIQRKLSHVEMSDELKLTP